MSDLTAFGKANLPAPASLAAALKRIDPGVAGGDVLLKMDKTGHWVFGADQTEVEDGSEWAINPFSFVHGWIAWGSGEVLGEKMVGITEPLPEVDMAPPSSSRGWEKQLGMNLKCMNGEDKDLDVRFATTSSGGKRALSELANEIAAQFERDPDKCVPIVALEAEHYAHKKYGRVYTPAFKIVRWVSIQNPADTKPAAASQPSAAAEDAPETRRRRRA